MWVISVIQFRCSRADIRAGQIPRSTAGALGRGRRQRLSVEAPSEQTVLYSAFGLFVSQLMVA
jgi:hypothetical protein